MGKQLAVAGAVLLAILLPSLVDPWSALPFEPIKVSFLRTVVIVLFALTIVYQVSTWRRRVRWRPRLPWPICTQSAGAWLMLAGALLFTLAMLVSTLSSSDPRYSLWGGSDRHGAVTAVCGVLLYLLLAFHLRTPGQTRSLILALAAGSVPVCLYGFVQFTQLDPLPWQTDSVSPVLSTLGRSNFVAAYLAVTIPLTLVIAWLALRYRALTARIASVTLVAMQAGCLALTQARAGWLAFVAGCAVFLTIAYWPRGWRMTLLVVALFVLASSAIFWGLDRGLARFPALPITRPGSASIAERREASVDRRFVIWRHTLPIIGERWLIGYGPEMFMPIFNRRYPPGTLYSGNDILVDDPHNLPLELAINGGLFGLATWQLMIIGYFVQLYQWTRTTPDLALHQLVAGLAGAMVAYLIQAQFNPDVVVLTTLFWLLLAMATSLQSLVPKQNGTNR